MDTRELIERMTKLGWEPHPRIKWGQTSVGYFDGDVSNEFVFLTDQHARDLLCADFARWLIRNGRKYVESSMYSDHSHRAWVDGHRVDDADKLEALVTAAEAAMGGG